MLVCRREIMYGTEKIIVVNLNSVLTSRQCAEPRFRGRESGNRIIAVQPGTSQLFFFAFVLQEPLK